MSIEVIPYWMENLEEEDIEFIRKFVLSSGSLKQMAKDYGVTYPTVRLRLDKLIAKIELEIDENNTPFVVLIKKLSLEDRIDLDTAKLLINAYKKEKKQI